MPLTPDERKVLKEIGDMLFPDHPGFWDRKIIGGPYGGQVIHLPSAQHVLDFTDGSHYELQDDRMVFVEREHGICSCHLLPMHRNPGDTDSEWAHDSDNTAAEVVHVHIESSSQDCDGRMSSGRTITLKQVNESPWWQAVKFIYDREVADEHDMWNLISPAPCRLPEDDESFTVKYDEDAIYVFIGNMEGGSNTIYQRCTETYCFEDLAAWQRDHQAEAAGY